VPQFNNKPQPLIPLVLGASNPTNSETVLHDFARVTGLILENPGIGMYCTILKAELIFLIYFYPLL
jgi:hypothetical protein